MNIFLVVPGQIREDHSGRECVEFEFDEYDEIGYFTSRECAQSWIDEQNGQGNLEYQKAVAAFPAKVNRYQLAEVKHRDNQAAIAARAKTANVPYLYESRYAATPRKPMLREYISTEYEIWEVNQHTKE